MKNKEYHKLAGHLGRVVPVRLVSGVSAESWARAAGLLGVAAVGMALAQLTWRLIPLPHETTAPVTPASQAQTPGKSVLSISELADGHLFGTPLAQPGGAINAPETTLNLILRGIFALDNDRALAIIAPNGGEELPYRTGDSLPGGAVVHEIVSDRVILDRGGQYETLTLPKNSIENGAPAQANGSTGNAASPAHLGEIRNLIKANPAEVMGMNAIRPVMENGQLKGYQLADNPYTPAMREAGMMPGDVVTEINGIPVTDRSRAAEVLNQLSNSGRVDIEVERDGVPASISVDFAK